MLVHRVQKIDLSDLLPEGTYIAESLSTLEFGRILNKGLHRGMTSRAVASNGLFDAVSLHESMGIDPKC